MMMLFIFAPGMSAHAELYYRPYRPTPNTCTIEKLTDNCRFYRGDRTKKAHTYSDGSAIPAMNDQTDQPVRSVEISDITAGRAARIQELYQFAQTAIQGKIRAGAKGRSLTFDEQNMI